MSDGQQAGHDNKQLSQQAVSKPSKKSPRHRLSARPSGLHRTLNPSYRRTREGLAKALVLAVDNSEKPSDNVTTLRSSSLAPASDSAWLSGIIDPKALHKLFAAEHLGNYVIVRKTGEKRWEKMPLYARIGMHLLFYGPAAIRFVTWKWIRKLLKVESIRQGKIYDSTDPKTVLNQITGFISTYSIDTSELLERDIKKYPTFNAFFSRRLKPNARPVASPNDPSIISSAADARLMVFTSVPNARKFWIKGKNFTIARLLKDAKLTAAIGENPCLAVWRLAPQDYHRFHSPVTATVRSIKHIPGQYYTVNPQAINEDLDVFTANTRSIAVLDAKLTKKDTATKGDDVADDTIPIAFVAVGALLVGSIKWEKTPGQVVQRGENLGFFAYGGSTVIGIFPKRANIQWDDDLSRASEGKIEVLVRAGERVGIANVGGSA